MIKDIDVLTSDLCDENQEKQIRVLAPNFKNFGGLKRFCAKVQTLKLDKNNHKLLELLKDTNGEDKVLVVDNSQEYFAVVGDKLMAFAQKNNWKAIIINGYVRDTQNIKDIPVGLFALGTCPRRYFPQTNSCIGETLNFGGIEINSGDFVYADEDGIIFSNEELTYN